MKKILKYVLLPFSLMLIISCSDEVEESEKVLRIEYTIDTMNSQQLLNLSLIHNNFDIEQLSRVYGCSVYTLDRIDKGESMLTNDAKLKIKNILTSVLNGKKFNDFDDENDGIFTKVYYWFADRTVNEDFETNLDLLFEVPVEKRINE